jgi:ABC-type iron transport system FetAB ATPase subunit
MYRANGAVATPCLAQYSDLLAQYYTSLNQVLTQRCSAVNVNMSVSFVDSKPRLLEENVVQVMYYPSRLKPLQQQTITVHVVICNKLLIFMLLIIDAINISNGGTRGSIVVKALCYKPEGRGFRTR